MKIMASAENYLERILMLNVLKGEVYAVDIARSLNVTKASVSVALKKLRENDFITVRENSRLELTDKGHDIAYNIFLRHKFFSDWLIELGVPQDVAIADACKLEHGLSDQSFAALQRAADIDFDKSISNCDMNKYF